MDSSKTRYTNASVIIGGAVCAVLAANHLMGRMTDGNEPSVFPGFRMMCGLCFPILYFWAGMLLRSKIKEPKWWFQILLAGAAIFCLYRYRHFAENRDYADALYISMAIIGFLTPPKTLLSSSRNKGWISLVLIALCAFCYTALATVKDRLLWGPVIPGHPDMELMMETILVNAEPLMMMVTIYFVAQFAFSEVAQELGSQAWFRGIVIFPVIYTFILFLGNLSSSCWWWKMNLLRFLVHPLTIYLEVVTLRWVRRCLSKEKERRPIKELLEP